MYPIFAAISSLLLLVGFAAPVLSSAPPIIARRWQPPLVLNQYTTPMCVGFATAAWLETAPHVVPNIPTPEEIYTAAQAIDGNPARHDGTAVWAALLTLKDAHYIGYTGYTAAITDVLPYLAKTGPVILWGPWLSGMDSPQNGRMHYSGNSEALHAFEGYGDEPNPAGGWDVLIQNSYGPGWGNDGRSRISSADLQRFFDDGGGAAFAEKLVWWTTFSALPH